MIIVELIVTIGFKLSVLFPTDLHAPRVYKNAPFDVCESKLTDTSLVLGIKLNIILYFIGLTWLNRKATMLWLYYQIILLLILYGEDYPLGLTAQYSGGGLWGPDYK